MIMAVGIGLLIRMPVLPIYLSTSSVVDTHILGYLSKGARRTTSAFWMVALVFV